MKLNCLHLTILFDLFENFLSFIACKLYRFFGHHQRRVILFFFLNIYLGIALCQSSVFERAELSLNLFYLLWIELNQPIFEGPSLCFYQKDKCWISLNCLLLLVFAYTFRELFDYIFNQCLIDFQMLHMKENS